MKQRSAEPELNAALKERRLLAPELWLLSARST